jgi:hypothetical protein
VHAVDVIAVCIAVVMVMLCAGVLARQRYMLRVQGGVPMAVHGRSNRWLYGIGRYVGGELRWYRAIGIGTRPTTVLRRADTIIVSRRRCARSPRRRSWSRCAPGSARRRWR